MSELRKKLTVVGILAASLSNAEVLLVTSEGTCLWAKSVRKDGDAVAYIDRENGEERRIAQSALDGVVYPVQRGKQYSTQDVEKRVETIRKLKAKHPPLTKPLNEMLQQWEALTRPMAELEVVIKDISGAFDSSARDAIAYRKASIELDMLAYKDVSGMYAEKIRELKDRIRRDYVAVNIERLEQMAAHRPVTADHFIAMRRIAEPLADAAPEEIRTRIAGIMSTARRDATVTAFRQVDALSGQGVSLNVYLRCSSILLLVRDAVAAEPVDKAETDKRLAALRAAAASRLGDYTFYGEGFPLAKEDREALSKAAGFSARMTLVSRFLEERAMLIPLAFPGNISIGRPFSIRFRAVFNSVPATNSVYGLTVIIPGAKMAYEHTRRLPPLLLAGAKVDFTMDNDFHDIPDEFEPGTDRQGRYCLYVVLSRLVSEPDAASEQWVDVSRGCQLPISLH